MDGVPRGAVLIDPHGTLFGNVLRWYIGHGLNRVRHIRVLDPSDPNRVFHLDPLRRRPGVDPAVVASAVVNAVLRVWGGDATATPQLRTTLKHTFFTLCELGLPLTRAADLLDLTDASGLRAEAAQRVSNPVVRQFWRELDALRLPQREERVGSAKRRLVEFLLPARVRAIFGEADEALDWRQVMDEGEIVLVNLAFDSGRLSEDEAQVIGVMMLAEIFLSCQGRPEGSLPFYLYIDECHRFLTEDVAKVIVEGRKFGVHAGALIHQTIGQLREAGEFVLSAVMTCRTKVAFGGLEPDDAEFMARSLFRGQFNLQRDKERFRTPIVVGQELDWLWSESATEGTAKAEGATWSEGRAIAHSRSITRSQGTAITSGTTVGESQGTNEQRQRSQSETRSASEASLSSRSASRGTSESVGGSASHGSGTSAATAQRYRENESDTVGGPSITEGRSVQKGSAALWQRGSSTASAESSGTAHTTGSATSFGEATAAGRSRTKETARSTSIAHSAGIAETEGVTATVNWSRGGSRTVTESEASSVGRSQTFRSVYEVRPGQAYTLEELIHLASVTLGHLPQGECVVKIGRRPSVRIRAVRVADGAARETRIERAVAKLAAATPYITAVNAPQGPRRVPVLHVVPFPDPPQEGAKVVGKDEEPEDPPGWG
ncbi:MAG: hypothetical protein ACREFQ_11590 [Stellaceae bacterium]